MIMCGNESHGIKNIIEFVVQNTSENEDYSLFFPRGEMILCVLACLREEVDQGIVFT